MKLLIICRGPIADETLRVMSEKKLPKPHVLISRREWLDILETQAPWLHDWTRFAQIHLVNEYSDIDSIISIVKEHNLDAVYPGYGFLAENASFGKRCEDEGIIFIGPTSQILELMGLKNRARAICRDIAIPVTPGTEYLEKIILLQGSKEQNLISALSKKLVEKKIKHPELSKDFLKALEIAYKCCDAEKIELFTIDEWTIATTEEVKNLWKEHGTIPIRIKASSGGGGKGQRVITSVDEIAKAMREVWNEIETNTKSVILEANIEEARHMEVQILGDGEDVVHFAVRNCSLQTMFYQKLIETAIHQGQIDHYISEEKSDIDDLKAERELIGKLQDAAVKIGKHINYLNAGTVEFLVDKNRNFYFMEVNARLQVEHGISEEISQINGKKLCLIEEQIRIATGEKLGYIQEDVHFSGYAIELRISLLDSLKLRPAPGASIYKFDFPKEKNVRIEDSGMCSALKQRKEIVFPAQYDANISLHIYTAKSYDEMLQNAISNLEKRNVVGENLKTTIPFHLTILHWLKKNQPLPQVTTAFVGIHLCLVQLLQEDMKQLQMNASELVKEHKRNPFPCLFLLKKIIDHLAEDPSLGIAFAMKENTFSTFTKYIKSLANYLHINIWTEDKEYLDMIDMFVKNIETITSSKMELVLENLKLKNESWEKIVDTISDVTMKTKEEVWEALLNKKEKEIQPTMQLTMKLQKILDKMPHKKLKKVPGKSQINVPLHLGDKEERNKILNVTPEITQDNNEIVSPILGIFYASPKPGEPFFVQNGEAVKIGQTLFLVGAMKVYSEIQAPRDGEIKKILVEDGELVKQGQVIIVLGDK